MRFTKNHIAVEGTKIGPSEFLLASLGGEPKTYLDPIGTKVEAGKPFGRIEGSKQACHLYAPFALTILGHDKNRALISIDGQPREDFLEEKEYRTYLEKLSR